MGFGGEWYCSFCVKRGDVASTVSLPENKSVKLRGSEAEPQRSLLTVWHHRHPPPSAVGQHLFNAVLHLLRRLLQLHLAQFGDDGSGLLAGGLLALLGVDRLEHLRHVFDLRAGYDRKNIAIEVHRAALVFRLWKDLANCLKHPQAFVSNDELHAIQASSLEPLEEADPAGLVLLHALCRAQNLPVSVLIDRNRHQYGHVFVLSAPVPTQIDAIHVHIRILSALQWTVSPVLDVDISLLVQLADCGGRYLAAPQRLRDVLYPTHRYARKIYLDQRFLYAALPAAVSPWIFSKCFDVTSV